MLNIEAVIALLPKLRCVKIEKNSARKAQEMIAYADSANRRWGEGSSGLQMRRKPKEVNSNEGCR